VKPNHPAMLASFVVILTAPGGLLLARLVGFSPTTQIYTAKVVIPAWSVVRSSRWGAARICQKVMRALRGVLRYGDQCRRALVASIVSRVRCGHALSFGAGSHRGEGVIEL
jgi:hypothetical protein